MKTANTINVKGLSHEEKEERVFPAVEGLDQEESVKIVFDFNPLPLVYMLRANEEYQTSYDKEGPEEWILNVKRIAPKKDRKEMFKKILKDLENGTISEETKEEAKGVFQTIDAKTLGLIEQKLINEGVSRDKIRKSLCDIHLEVLRDTLISKQIEVSAPHPVHTLMEEHQVILGSLNELDDSIGRLKEKTNFESMPEDIKKLKEISHHLVEAESHHQREEDILFPKLEKHGITEPTEIMKLDHTDFRQRKQKLYEVTHNWQDYSFDEYKENVTELGNYLAVELEKHIFKEDSIIYQIAFQILTAEDWEEVKRECDKIGYCCFTPQDQKEEQ